MIHAAEDAARFLHQACQGLPHRLNGHVEEEPASGNGTRERSSIDKFYARVIEHAVAYFGSRVLYPSRPAPEDASTVSRAACEKAAQAAARADARSMSLPRRSWATASEARSTMRIWLAKWRPAGCAAFSWRISTNLAWPAKCAPLSSPNSARSPTRRLALPTSRLNSISRMLI